LDVARAKKSSSGGLGGFLLGFVLALALAGVAAFVYLRTQDSPRVGKHLRGGMQPALGGDAADAMSSGDPMAGGTATSPAPRPAPHAFRQPPFGTSEDVFEAGAHVYRNDCARCHGTPNHDAAFAAQMHPPAVQLWRKRPRSEAVGVSAEAPGETFAKIAEGHRTAGMPAYAHVLTERQIWEVSLLLKSADQPLPDPVEHILNTGKP
jgi:mono/diheme cytochrome c family protein